MVLLQHRLNVKLSQRQILTPGLVQMVSVLALNKLELKDMINAEMVENPVLEELEDAVPLLDDVGRQEDTTIAKKDLEAAQNAEDKAQIDLKTTRDHIRVLGGDPDRVSPIVNIVAPISGTIVEQNVTGAAGVRSLDNSPNLFTVADLSRVWVLCDIYEDAISRVHIGDIAEVRLNAYPDRLFHGSVSNISRVLDPNTRSAKVRIELDNPGQIMRSGMFVTAELSSRERIERPVLPTTAIVRLHDKDWVFMPLGGNRFQKMEIQIGPSMGDNLQQILGGVKIHDKVVVNALQFSSAAEAK